MRDWASAAPNDVVVTATGELAGTTTSATYGGAATRRARPTSASLERRGGVRIPLRSRAGASRVSGSPRAAWSRVALGPGGPRVPAGDEVRRLAAAPGGSPAKVASGDYGPVPVRPRGRGARPAARGA